MLNGIKLPLLSVAMLYAILHFLIMLLGSYLVIITDLTLLKLSDFIITKPMLLSSSV